MRDDTRVTRPALRAGDRQPVPPAVLPGGGMLSPLDSADASFRALTTGPQPLALHTASLAPGLPDRQVPLDELRALLLHPATGTRARNQVWAELVRRARSGLPGLGRRPRRRRHARPAPRRRQPVRQLPR